MIDLIATIILLLTLWLLSKEAKKLKAKERAQRAWKTRKTNQKKNIIWIVDPRVDGRQV